MPDHDADLEFLGPSEPWTIKSFPRELRIKIIRAAQDAGLGVGEYLIPILSGAREPAQSFHIRRHAARYPASRIQPPPHDGGCCRRLLPPAASPCRGASRGATTAHDRRHCARRA